MVHPLLGYVHKDLSLGFFIHILAKSSVVHCTILLPLHLDLHRSQKYLNKNLTTQQKDLIQPQQYTHTNPIMVLIHSTYTKLGQCPYKNPNPKWIRFVHFLLDLILVGPRSNRSPSRCLSTFQLLCNSLSTL
jgi:hypothetical protein